MMCGFFGEINNQLAFPFLEFHGIRGILTTGVNSYYKLFMTPLSLIILYCLFRAKHFACDFLLQTDWMALTKGKPGREGYRALFVHSAIHALGTLLIVLIFAPALWWLGLLDFVVHSVIDRIKGYFTYRNGWAPKDTVFWWTLGLDQEAHNFTHLAYIIYICLFLGGIVAIPR